MTLFDITDRIRQARIEKGLSQQELADGAGLSRHRVTIIETGQADDLQYANLRSLLRELDLGLRLRAHRGGMLSFEDKIAEREEASAGWFRTPEIDDLARALRRERKRQKMTQEQVAAEAGISRVSLNRFERGLVDDMRFSTLERLLEAANLELVVGALGEPMPSYEQIRADDTDLDAPDM